MYPPEVKLIVKFGVSIVDTVQLSSGLDAGAQHTVSTIRFGEQDGTDTARTNESHAGSTITTEDSTRTDGSDPAFSSNFRARSQKTTETSTKHLIRENAGEDRS